VSSAGAQQIQPLLMPLLDIWLGRDCKFKFVEERRCVGQRYRHETEAEGA